MKTRPEDLRPWRKVLIFVACCILYIVPFASDLTSGIPYSELLLEPCEGEQFQSNGTATAVPLSGPTTTNRALVNGSVATTSFSSEGVTTAPPAALTDRPENRTGAADCGGFGLGASRTAWVASIYTGVRVGTSWLNGVAFDILGGRKTAFLGLFLTMVGCVASSFAQELYVLYITRGVVAGLGGGLLYQLSVPFLDKVFRRRKTLILASCFASNGLGAVVLALLGKEAILFGGWRWYYRMLAMVSAASMAVVFVLPSGRAEHEDEGRHTALKERRSSVDSDVEKREVLSSCQQLRQVGTQIKMSFCRGMSLYKNLNFTLLVTAYVTLSFAYFFPILTARHRASTFPDADGNTGFLQIILIGGGTLAGGLASGLVVEYLPVPMIFTLGIVLLLQGMACGLSALIVTQTGLYYFLTMYAFLASAMASLGAPVALRIVSAEQVPHASGQMILLCSITVLCGPPSAARLYETSGSYVLPVTLAGILLAVAGGLILLLELRVRWQDKARNAMKGGLCDSSQNPISPCDASQNPNSQNDTSQSTNLTECPVHRNPIHRKPSSQTDIFTDSPIRRKWEKVGKFAEKKQPTILVETSL